MDEMIKVLAELARQQGVGFVVAAIFLGLYTLERKARNQEREAHAKTADRLIELSSSSVRADEETAAAVRMLTRILDGIDRRV